MKSMSHKQKENRYLAVFNCTQIQESNKLTHRVTTLMTEAIGRTENLFVSYKKFKKEMYQLKAESVQLKADLGHETTEVCDTQTEIARRLPSDKYEGCSKLRTLRTLLKIVDESGFERSPHQLQFHSAFEQACARILYRNEFDVHYSAIMRTNGWTDANGEVLISTPRRFGKTYSVAQFCACLALSCRQDIVIFSPGRRASRSILVKVQDFVQVVGMSSRIDEYNQEQLRLRALDGSISTVRSFPSKVQVTKKQANKQTNKARVTPLFHLVCMYVCTCVYCCMNKSRPCLLCLHVSVCACVHKMHKTPTHACTAAKKQRHKSALIRTHARTHLHTTNDHNALQLLLSLSLSLLSTHPQLLLGLSSLTATAHALYTISNTRSVNLEPTIRPDIGFLVHGEVHTPWLFLKEATYLTAATLSYT